MKRNSYSTIIPLWFNAVSMYLDPWWLSPEENESHKFCCFAELEREAYALAMWSAVPAPLKCVCHLRYIRGSHSTQFSFSPAHSWMLCWRQARKFCILQSQVLPPPVPLLMTCVRHHDESKLYLWKFMLVNVASCHEPVLGWDVLLKIQTEKNPRV